MVKIRKQIFKLAGFLILVLIIFSMLPYKKQIILGQIPLSVGSEIDPEFGELLIVPGSGCNPGRGTEERLNLASVLYQQKRRKVIVSEGTCSKAERADFMHRIEHKWRIARQDVIWDTLSLTTEANILNSKKIAEDLGLKDAIVCTSKFHQLRCSILMYKYWEGDFSIARMPKELIEMDKETVYIQKRGRVLKQEYAKCLYELMHLFS